MKLPLGLIIGGFLLVVVSWILPDTVGGENALPVDIQQKLEESGKFIEMHHSDDLGDAATQERMKALEEERRLLFKQIQLAQTRGAESAFVLKWLGIALFGIGLVLHLLQRFSEPTTGKPPSNKPPSNKPPWNKPPVRGV